MLAALRSRTRGQHAALDGSFPRGLADRGTYVAYLLAMSGLAGLVDATPRSSLPIAWRSWHESGPLAAISADLSHFDRRPRDWLLEPLSPEAWIGACYVFNGSALGARLLRRQAGELAARDAGVACALRFLTLHAGGSGGWRAFLGTLSDVPADAHSAAVEGAHRAFAMTQSILDEALAE